MRSISPLILPVLLAMAIWAVLVFTGTRNGWWRADLGPRDDVSSFFSRSAAAIDTRGRGSVAFVLIEKGRVVDEHFVSSGAPVTRDTLFQLASLSKMVTAMGVLKLVSEGALNLDAPVSRYLKRWHLPENDFDNDGVTVRRLLSHTAGFRDGLGHMGFGPDENVQSLEESLTKAVDAMPGADGRSRVVVEPGTSWSYSGGSYALLQLLVEEVSGEPFNVYMRHAVFEPLGMETATFDLEEAKSRGLAPCLNGAGEACIYQTFSASSAAALSASAADLIRFMKANMAGDEPAFLPSALFSEMREPQAWKFGIPIWGLGVILYAEAPHGGFIVGHDGQNAPAIESTIRFDPKTGDGILVLANGDPGLTSTLGDDWVYWYSGRVGVTELDNIILFAGLMLFAGWIAIITLAAFGLRRML